MAVEPPPIAPAEELGSAMAAGQIGRARATLDRLLTEHSQLELLREAIVPALRSTPCAPRTAGAGRPSSLALSMLREWLLTRARGWGSGRGPRVLLACPPGEQHDIGLICFGLALRAHGWRVTYLGPALPVETLVETAGLLAPAQIVVSATIPELAARAEASLRELSDVAPLALAGNGASPDLADAIGAIYLDDDPISAAMLTASEPARG